MAAKKALVEASVAMPRGHDEAGPAFGMQDAAVGLGKKRIGVHITHGR